jgi:hypothetical protein
MEDSECLTIVGDADLLLLVDLRGDSVKELRVTAVELIEGSPSYPSSSAKHHGRGSTTLGLRTYTTYIFSLLHR